METSQNLSSSSDHSIKRPYQMELEFAPKELKVNSLTLVYMSDQDQGTKPQILTAPVISSSTWDLEEPPPDQRPRWPLRSKAWELNGPVRSKKSRSAMASKFSRATPPELSDFSLIWFATLPSTQPSLNSSKTMSARSTKTIINDMKRHLSQMSTTTHTESTCSASQPLVTEI